jgi:hypothetical protein
MPQPDCYALLASQVIRNWYTISPGATKAQHHAAQARSTPAAPPAGTGNQQPGSSTMDAADAANATDAATAATAAATAPARNASYAANATHAALPPYGSDAPRRHVS